MTRATVFGAYDGDVFGVLERVSDHVATPAPYQPRQRMWVVRTRRAIMATGAIERPFVFAGNDRPGVMLAGAVRAYLNRYAVLPSREVVVASGNDSTVPLALELAAAGARVTFADCRKDLPGDVRDRLSAAGIDVKTGFGVLKVSGQARVKSAAIAPVNPHGKAIDEATIVPCGLVAVSAGWQPALHLWSQRAGRPAYDESISCFVPESKRLASLKPAGSAAGLTCTADCMADGFSRGREAAASVEAADGAGTLPTFETDSKNIHAPSPVWSITGMDGRHAGKAFIDLQHDVTVDDVDLAHREGFVSVEHLKRYTTTGMAGDQGKLSNVNALARMAEQRGISIAEAGTTTFRPPYAPVSIGAIAGRQHGRELSPIRRTAMHDWHEANGAVMTEAGTWMRPWYYPKTGETIVQAYIREAAQVRENVGIVDVSTLGKIMVQGPDAAEFLNRVYVNGFKTLAVGRLRYGIMLREDGFVFDDGTVARWGEHDYLMTTTTTNAGPVMSFLEHLLQTAWRDLRVVVTSVTDQWAAAAIAGPKSRALLSGIADVDLSNDALPANHLVEANIAGSPVRIHRMSYSGELAYEVFMPSTHAARIWEAIVAAGAEHKLLPYGTESMGTLRIEKGHVAGPELDGRTTLGDLGLAKFASTKKPFVGSVLRHRQALEELDRPTLVGLEIEGEEGTRPGSLLYAVDARPEGHGEGHVTSTTYSPALGKHIALALLTSGADRHGQDIKVVDFLTDTTWIARVVSPHFYDPESKRQNS